MNKKVPDLNKNKSLPNLILYGNLDGKEIIVINVDEMKVHSVISLTNSAEPYAIDRIKNSNVLLSIARKYNLVEQIEIKSLSDNYKFDHICTQKLKHSPRTARGNEKGNKALISGANVALSTVLDLSCSCGEIILEVGDPKSKQGTGATSGIDYGGSNASGHEFWIDNERFAVLNRVKRDVEFYDRTSSNPSIPFFTLKLTTTPHHLLADKNSGKIYVSCEGSPSRFLPPSIFLIEETKSGFVPVGQTFLPVSPFDIKKSGGHHLDKYEDKIFMGSAEGNCYVIDSQSLNIITKIKTGLGHGHTGFIEHQDKTYAVTINHKDIFTSIIDVNSLKKLGDVQVSDNYPKKEDSGRTKLAQGHTSFKAIRDGKPYFYLMVSHESKFLEIDILEGKITRTLDFKEDSKTSEFEFEKLYMVQGTAIAQPSTLNNQNNQNREESEKSTSTINFLEICTSCK